MGRPPWAGHTRCAVVVVHGRRGTGTWPSDGGTSKEKDAPTRRYLEQSEPAVSGHGSHAPEEQLPGVVQLSACSPTLQPQLKSPGL